MEKKAQVPDLNENSRATYVSEIEKIKRSSQSPEDKVNLLDLLLKDFFRKRFHFKRNAEYSEMIDFFLEKNKPELAVFCHNMIKQLYSGDTIDQNSVSLILENSLLMVEREMRPLDQKSKIKGVFSSLFKKKSIPAQADMKVSKQTEKEINKKLPSDSGLNTIASEISYLKSKNNDMNELRNKLNLSMQEESKKDLVQDEYDTIERIDSLDRIKDKIKRRKLSISNEKNEENPQ